jgi:hypothetical protein
MLITKTSPKGVDWYIQALQTKLYDFLLAKWSGVNYQSYGRCYRNRRGDSYIAEVLDSGNEYKEVYWDDSFDVVSFFGIDDTVTKDLQSKVNVHLVFFVNLSAVKPSISHRADEEARQDVLSLLGNKLNGFIFESLELWTENVLKEYTGSLREERLNAVDMHPIHCFRLNFSLIFDQNKIC